MGAAISQTVSQGRQSSHVQQCARLLTSYSQGLLDPRQCTLANARMTACLQQQSTFCTEPASDVSTDSWQQPPNAQSKQLGPIISMLAKELQAQ
ncbi:TPA: hypothetical protein ACH3X2_013574 [Trebouxia sp. C0005]